MPNFSIDIAAASHGQGIWKSLDRRFGDVYIHAFRPRDGIQRRGFFIYACGDDVPPFERGRKYPHVSVMLADDDQEVFETAGRLYFTTYDFHASASEAAQLHYFYQGGAWVRQRPAFNIGLARAEAMADKAIQLLQRVISHLNLVEAELQAARAGLRHTEVGPTAWERELENEAWFRERFVFPDDEDDDY